MLETQIVVWTARLAVGCYLASLMLQVANRRPKQAFRLWVIGFAIFLIHLCTAFEFVHDWSHRAAWDHTAQQTEKLTGWNWGGGLWFNYLFALLWGFSAIRMSRSDSQRDRVFWLIHAYLGFIVFNATVVFGAWWWKYFAMAYLLLLFFLWRMSGSTAERPG